MDNKEIATLLRSLADVYESNTNSDSMKVIFKMIMDKVTPHGVGGSSGFTDTEDKSPYIFTSSDVKNGYHVKNILQLIKKMEENDKLRAYKVKLTAADPSYERILTDIDKTRGDIIEKHIEQFKHGVEVEDILTTVPNDIDYKLPGGKTLREILLDLRKDN